MSVLDCLYGCSVDEECAEKGLVRALGARATRTRTSVIQGESWNSSTIGCILHGALHSSAILPTYFRPTTDPSPLLVYISHQATAGTSHLH